MAVCARITDDWPDFPELFESWIGAANRMLKVDERGRIMTRRLSYDCSCAVILPLRFSGVYRQHDAGREIESWWEAVLTDWDHRRELATYEVFSS